MTGCLPGLSQFRIEAHEPPLRLNFRAGGPGAEECLVRVKHDDFYRVADDEVACLVPGVAVYSLVPCVTCYRSFFLWPVPVLLDPAEASDAALAAHEVLEQAVTKFVQVSRIGDSLQVTAPRNRIMYNEPPIPAVDLEAAIECAFADRTIRSVDEPIAKKLRQRAYRRELQARRASLESQREASGS